MQVHKLKKVELGHKFIISLSYSEFCGYAKFDDFNFNSKFKFEDEHAGVIAFHSIDLKNSLIIDFYEEYGERLLDVSIYGEKWGEICREILLT